LESFAGQDAIVARAGLPRGSTSTDIVAAARLGDPRTLEALEVAGAALGVALANVANIVEVQHVILGGIYAEMAEYLRAGVLAQLERRAISAPWAGIELSVAKARQYPAMTGAAIEALQTLVEEPALWLGG
jgi:predicted NBD/HSP70 family sugar kinase